MFDELHEECGVFGCYHIPDAASMTYYGLHSLQHRGQEASGIAAEHDGEITVLKGRGQWMYSANRSWHLWRVSTP